MSDKSATKEITIQGVAFTVAMPYAAGQTITEAEAAALNQTRAENIRNNKAKAVKAAKEEHGDTLPDDVLKSLANEVAEYDAAYEFNMASVGGGRAPVDPVEKEAIKIAKAALAAKIKDAGSTVKEYTSSDEGKARYDELVAKVASDEKVIAAAKKAVKEREAQMAAASAADIAL